MRVVTCPYCHAILLVKRLANAADDDGYARCLYCNNKIALFVLGVKDLGSKPPVRIRWTETRRKIAEFLKANPQSTRLQISAAVQESETTVYENLKQLTKKQVLVEFKRETPKTGRPAFVYELRNPGK